MLKSRFKQTEIGMIPEDWEVKMIGDFLDIKHGFAFKGEFFSDAETDNILLTPGNFNIGGGFKSDKLKFTIEEPPRDYVLKEGDIIVTMTDLSKKGDTLGYSAKIPPTKNKRYLHNQRIGLLNFKSNEVNTDFIYWVLRTKRYNLFVVGSATGSTVKHTSPNRIKLFVFGVPLIEEQTHIAKILSDLDSKIELNQQMNKTLESIGRAIFKHWFIDFEFPNGKGKPYKSSGGEMIDSELGEIPKGWGAGKIFDLCSSITSGSTPKRMEDNFWGGKIAWFKTGELTDGPLLDSEEHISEEGLKNSACKLWNINTVLIALYASPTVGRLGLLKTKATSNQACSGLVAKKEIGYPFLFLSLFFKRDELNSFAVGAAQQNINQNVLKETKIIIPTNDVLLEFNAMQEDIFNKITFLVSQNRSLSQIRDSLLPRLMSGKIRVPVEEPPC